MIIKSKNLSSVKAKSIIETKNISSTIGDMISVVERNSINPIFNNLKICSKDSQLQISTINQESSVTKLISAKIEKNGSFTVSARLFYDILRKIDDEEISLSHFDLENELHIRGQNCQFVLPTLPVEDYPTFDSFEYNSKLRIESEHLAQILENTYFSISNEETRYNLCGLCLHSYDEEKTITSASTDCHRLSLSSNNITNKTGSFNVIIPKKTIEELIKLSRNSINKYIDIELNNNLISIKDDTTLIISKLVDGIFPSYEELIPKENSNKLTINAKHISEILSRISIVTNNLGDKMRTIQITITEETLEVKANSITHYNCFAEEKIKLSDFNYTYQGDKITIGFNPRYLLDVFKTVGEHSVDIFLKDELSSILITTEKKPKTKFVVMPLKI